MYFHLSNSIFPSYRCGVLSWENWFKDVTTTIAQPFSLNLVENWWLPLKIPIKSKWLIMVMEQVSTDMIFFPMPYSMLIQNKIKLVSSLDDVCKGH